MLTCLEWSKQRTPFDFETNIARRPLEARPDHKFLVRQAAPCGEVSQPGSTAFSRPGTLTAFFASSSDIRGYADS
ncbi:MAG: hypothetical protein ACJA0Y_000274 [Maricaulis maris]|jgi:hypothetical protein